MVAGIAQLVEQLIRNQQVGGSSPLPGSIEYTRVSKGYGSLKPFFMFLKIAQKGSKKKGAEYIQNAYTQTFKFDTGDLQS